MLIDVEHRTDYTYEQPVSYTIQSLKLTPSNTDGQRVRSWAIDTGGYGDLPAFHDSFGNLTHTFVANGFHDRVTIVAKGQVETKDTQGMVTGTWEPFPLSAYLRLTDLTRPSDDLVTLARKAQGGENRLDELHRLANLIRDAVDYRIGETQVETEAADALNHGFGVCQDHAHVFISACRMLSIPARYVSGYLVASANLDEIYEASHAWAEAHVPDIGWVGFDVSNRICPTDAYLRVAVGLDYREAAPIRGLRRGGSGESLDVTVKVTQQQRQQQA